MAQAIGVIGAVTAIVGTGLSVFSSIKASKAEKKARKEEQRAIRARERRARRQQLREMRVRRAAALNTGVQIGGQGSSALEGGLGSLTSQAAGNIGASLETERTSRAISRQEQNIANARSLGVFAQGATNLGSGLFRNRQGIADFGNRVFGT